MIDHFIHRCFDLARLGIGKVAPNPAVGAVLVYEGKIIGEGFHEMYGKAHAEVNTIASVVPADEWKIKHSTIYISLEPCNIHGNTPPCTDLILNKKIPRVVVAQRDLTPGVNGAGLNRLRAAGVEVIEAVLAEDGQRFSNPRNIFVSQQRPYILLKWAQTQDGYFAPQPPASFWITNSYSKRLVHKWRGETQAILIGRNTAAVDNPTLTTRLYPGASPIRIVIDKDNSLSQNLNIFNDHSPTWSLVQEGKEDESRQHAKVIALDFSKNWIKDLLSELYKNKISHLTIEGGAATLQQFIDLQFWDEARVFKGNKVLGTGLTAPNLPVKPDLQYRLDKDRLYQYFNPHSLEKLTAATATSASFGSTDT